MEKVVNYNDDYDIDVPENDDFDHNFGLDSDFKAIDVTKEDTIDVNAVKVLEQEVQREKTLKEVLLKYMGKQASLALMNTGIWAKDGIDKIGKIVKGLEEKAQIYEKDYKSSIDKKESAIKEYEEAIEQASSWYKEAAEEKSKEIGKYQEEEHEGINEKSAAISKEKKMLASKEYKKYLKDKKSLEKEIAALAIEEDNDEILAAKRQELKELTQRSPIKQCKKEIKEAEDKIQFARQKINLTNEYMKVLEHSRNELLDKAKEDRDNALSGLVKQNFWQKLVGSIFNRFHSKKRCS